MTRNMVMGYSSGASLTMFTRESTRRTTEKVLERCAGLMGQYT